MTTTEDSRTLVAGLDFAGRQCDGMRESQQDAYGVVSPRDLGGTRSLLAIIADGMGGHAGGEVASETALQAFVDGFFDGTASDDGSRLWAGLELANKRIQQTIAHYPGLEGMGTTILAVLIRDDDMLRWISVGDSPLYLFRDGVLSRLNHLHVELPEAAEQPTVLPPHASLASAVIGERLYEVDDALPYPVRQGDTLILASDGLNTLPESELVFTLASSLSATAAECAERLLEAVRAHGRPKQDNTTVIVIRWR